jgi:hypothetical protein
VQVRCGEGGAIHTGPESCIVHREVNGEALTGEDAGQPLSGESTKSEGRCRATGRKRHEGVRYREDAFASASSETLACIDAFCTGTGRSPCLPHAVAREASTGR